MIGDIFSRKIEALRTGLRRSREILSTGVARIVQGGGDRRAVLDRLEELLVGADIGVQTASEIVRKVETSAQGIDETAIKAAVRQEITGILTSARRQSEMPRAKPHIVMVVGVNGTGKTTTIAKLAHREILAGRTVLLAACDTFRAAASEQLGIWASRVGAGIVKHKAGADAASVAYDACNAAKSRDIDTVIIDTAGRLQTKKNLMDEVAKIGRVLGKVVEGAPHEVLLVLDATTGQNAVSQAKAFSEACGVTGIVVAKLDGTAKGGIVVAISKQLMIPIAYVGTGETVDDLAVFDPSEFASALLD